MKLYLNIDNKWSEPVFDQKSFDSLKLNYCFDDLENPTNVLTEYSFDFTLPRCSENNKLLDMYYRLDTTTKYRPVDSIKYIYISDGDTISSGLMYMKEINKTDYVFTLNGALNIVFNKLLNSGWDINNDDDQYTLFDELWGNQAYIDTDFAIRSFATASIVFNEPTNPIYTNRLKACQYVGIIPTNSNKYREDFKRDKAISFGLLPTDLSGEKDEAEMGEYRVSEQNMYVYMLRLWQIYKRKCENITDFKLELDDRWFNSTYEYLSNLVYVLPKKTTTQEYDTVVSNSTRWYDNITYNNPGDWVTEHYASQQRTGSEPMNVIYKIQIPIRFGLNGNRGQGSDRIILNPRGYITFRVKVTDDNGEVYNKTFACNLLPDITDESGNYIVDLSDAYKNMLKANYDVVYFNRYTNNNIVDDKENYRHYYTYGEVKTKLVFENLQNPKIEILDFKYNAFDNVQCPFRYVRSNGDVETLGNFLGGSMDITPIIKSDVVLQSGRIDSLTMHNIFGTIRPFEIVLKHAKMLGLVWLVDEYQKKITVMRRADYIWDCFHSDMSVKSPSYFPYTGYFDATGLADFEEYTQIPLDWDSHNVLFNYADCDNVYAKKYADKYGITYGTKKVITQNNRNNKTKELLGTTDYNTVNPPIISQNSVMVYGTNESYIDDPYPESIDNTFLFRLPNSTYNKYGEYHHDSGGYYMVLSQDTQFEMWLGYKMWHRTMQPGDGKTYIRPVFSTTNSNGYSILFAKPREVYYNEDEGSTIYLFEAEWQNYVDEIYNADNKTLKIRMNIPYQLYNRLKICPFLAIGNVGYLVTEINDWSEIDKTTSVVLRQITNFDMLTQKAKAKLLYAVGD